MSDITSSSSSGPATQDPTDKGKGKAIALEEEESDSSDEEIDQAVRLPTPLLIVLSITCNEADLSQL